MFLLSVRIDEETLIINGFDAISIRTDGGSHGAMMKKSIDELLAALREMTPSELKTLSISIQETFSVNTCSAFGV